MAVVVAVPGAQATSRSISGVCATADGTACYDTLPVDDSWQASIGLTRVPNKYQGDGVAVASIDTGVTPNPNLGSRLLARVDFTADHDGIDHFGHGTHMAGLVAGDGTTSLGAHEGAAPETDLVSVKVAGWDGATDVTTVIAALQWAVSNRNRFGIRVVNLSWGTDAGQSPRLDPLDAAVAKAWAAGLVVVVSAGNGAAEGAGITKPGDDPHVITVGAADTAGTAAPADDSVAPFSARGGSGPGDAKPDVVAPGISLVSDRAPDSTIDHFRPEARVGADLFKGSGTSQAAAIVSGVVARMLEANPTLTPDQVKAVLEDTADPTLAGLAGGAGMVDAGAAIAAVAPRNSRYPFLTPGIQLVPPSTGLGVLTSSRGAHPVVADLDGDGVPTPLVGPLDALGLPWTLAQLTDDWTLTTWRSSPWANRVAEISGSSAAGPWSGPDVPLLAWEPSYWGARNWVDAGWDARYWGARYWGARYWGTGLWQ